MSQNTTEYTIERYKIDLRRKEGLRLIDRIDYITYDQLDSVVEDLEKDGYIVNVFETYTTQKNLITGQLYQERYDTPSFCSPSSESFWSM